MRPSLAVLAASVAAVHAFKGTSPFLFFSTSKFPSTLQDISVSQIQSSKAVLDTAKEFLSTCPTDVYYIIHQPSVHSTDLSISAIPNLQDALSSPGIKARYLVSETRGLGGDVKQDLVEHLKRSCGVTKFLDQDSTSGDNEDISDQISSSLKDGKKVVVLRTKQEIVGPKKNPQRQAMLNEMDESHKLELFSIIAEQSYTVIWTTTPLSGDSADVEDYEPEFQDPTHMELKRAISDQRRASKPTNITDHRPLFEKYQFFTPGIFMGLLTAVILISILSVGMTAISSLQVSYGAFDKEMGPAAQKKQQ